MTIRIPCAMPGETIALVIMVRQLWKVSTCNCTATRISTQSFLRTNSNFISIACCIYGGGQLKTTPLPTQAPSTA